MPACKRPLYISLEDDPNPIGVVDLWSEEHERSTLSDLRQVGVVIV